VLNIAYFWPVVYTAFFEAEDDHDAKPLVDFRLGGESRSTLAAADGGEPIDDAEDAGEDGEEVDPADPDPGDLQPDFSGSETGGRRDYSEPAPLVDGEYAVDQHPSDHVTAEEETEDGHEAAADDEHAGGADHDDHAHHEGPPPGGWRRLSPREALRGEETTWFMLGPILAAVTGAILLGVIPGEVVFLDLIEVIVEGVLAGTEVAP
jgi:multicomponent Na+:H+ antiporter subunit D